MVIDLITILLACQLAASGGGGGSGADASAIAVPVPATPAPTNSGPVLATFVPSAMARYIVYDNAGQSFGPLGTSAQNSSGAITTIADFVLSGLLVAAEDISADSSFAQGRWVAGTVANSVGSAILTGITDAAYHYLVFNELTAFPASGSARIQHR